MGVAISTTAALSPFSLATGIIGLVSFAFTVGTFLKVVWVNFETMSASEHGVHGYLTNLRAELLEERASIRHMRREAKSYRRRLVRDHNQQQQQHGNSSSSGSLGLALDDVSLKLLADYIRTLIRRFHDVEIHFLAPGAEGIDGYKHQEQRARHMQQQQHRQQHSRDRSASPYYQHSAYAYTTPPEKSGGRRRSWDGRERGNSRVRPQHQQPVDYDDEDGDPFWAQQAKYAPFTLGRRFVWLYRKSEVQSLYDSLTRVQIRRTARQVAGLSLAAHESGSGLTRLEESLARIDERMTRIVGVRRVE